MSRVAPGRVVALGVCLVLGVVFWNQPWLSPLKLLVVMMHESGHALATLLVGGSIQKVVIAANQSGQCLSNLPSGFFREVVIYSAGYLGSAAAGGALLVATYRWQLRRAVLAVLSGWLLLMGLLYAGDFFTLAFCIGMAVALTACAKLLPEGAVEVLDLFIAAFSALYALFDLRDDLWHSASRAHSDAALLANLTFIPAVVWAVIWTLFALAILAAATVWSLRGGRPPAPIAARSVGAFGTR